MTDPDLAIECATLCEWIYNVDFKATSIPSPTFPHMIEILNYEIVDFSEHYVILIARTRNNKDILFLVFRGTVDMLDILHDLDCGLKNIRDTTNPIVCRVHSGLRSKMEHNFWSIHPKIKQCVEQNGGKISQIIITGHSLGGGIASLYLFEVFRLQHTRNDMEFYDTNAALCITFGSPLVFAKVGYNEFNAKLFNKLDHSSHHFINNSDAVPRMLGNQQWLEYFFDAAKKVGYSKLHDNSTLGTQLKGHVATRYVKFGEYMSADKIKKFKNYVIKEISQHFSEYTGVGLYYIMDDKKNDVMLVFEKNLKTELYAAQNVNAKEIKEEEALSLIENHAMKAYKQTLIRNKGTLQLLYIGQKFKSVERRFVGDINSIKRSQIGIMQNMNSLKKSIKIREDRMEGKMVGLKSNQAAIDELKVIWQQNKQMLEQQMDGNQADVQSEMSEQSKMLIGSTRKHVLQELKINQLMEIQQKIGKELTNVHQKLDEFEIKMNYEVNNMKDSMMKNGDDILGITKELSPIKMKTDGLQKLIKKKIDDSNKKVNEQQNEFVNIKKEWTKNQELMKQNGVRVKKMEHKLDEIEEDLQRQKWKKEFKTIRKTTELHEKSLRENNGKLQQQEKTISDFRRFQDEINEKIKQIEETNGTTWGIMKKFVVPSLFVGGLMVGGSLWIRSKI